MSQKHIVVSIHGHRKVVATFQDPDARGTGKCSAAVDAAVRDAMGWDQPGLKATLAGGDVRVVMYRENLIQQEV
jgi:hypothetical protein